MEALRKLLDHPLFRLVAGIVGVLLALTPPVVREAIEDLYEAKWPFALGFALAVAALGVALSFGRSRNVRVVSHEEDLQKELRTTVRTAERTLMCIGSRGRDKSYLKAIEKRLKETPGLAHLRVLCGPPAHLVLKTHLLALESMKQVDTARFRLGMLDMATCDDPEQALCISEKRAVVVLAAVGEFGEYDSAIVLTGKRDVKRVTQYAESLWSHAEPFNAKSDIDALKPTKTGPA